VASIIPSKRKSVYWWTTTLSALRKAANHTRRVHQRKKKSRNKRLRRGTQRGEVGQATTFQGYQKREGAVLEKTMRRGRAQPLGKPYKLVMGKLTRSRPAIELQQPGVLQTIVNGLFPVHPHRDRRTWPRENAPNITEEELTRAAKSMKNNISPGIDGIINEALKAIVHHQPEVLLQLYNKCLEEGHFPRVWKIYSLANSLHDSTG